MQYSDLFFPFFHISSEKLLSSHRFENLLQVLPEVLLQPRVLPSGIRKLRQPNSLKLFSSVGAAVDTCCYVINFFVFFLILERFAKKTFLTHFLSPSLLTPFKSRKQKFQFHVYRANQLTNHEITIHKTNINLPPHDLRLSFPS